MCFTLDMFKNSNQQEVRMIVTSLHVERGRQMRQIVRHDVVQLGFSSDQAMVNLAKSLGIDLESVQLAIAIANEADTKSLEEINKMGAAS